MVAKADQQKIKALLKDTITLLCKNGLAYNTEFCVEALIGITLDKNDVMLVSINETVSSGLGKGDSSEVASDFGNDGDVSTNFPAAEVSTPRFRSSSVQSVRKRFHPDNGAVSKVEPESGPGEDDQWEEGSVGANNDESSSEATPAKRPFRVPKTEQEDSDQDDIVVIKEEIDDNWGMDMSTVHLPHRHGQQHTVEDADLSQVLQSGSLVPVSVQHQQGPGGGWTGGGRMTSAAMATQGAPGDAQDQQQDLQMPGLQQESPAAYSMRNVRGMACPLCGKVLESKSGYTRHIQTHQEMFRFRCPYCDKGYQQRSHYDGHLNMHAGRKPFLCTYCNRGFGIKHNAMHHERTCKWQFSPRNLQTNELHQAAEPPICKPTSEDQ